MCSYFVQICPVFMHAWIMFYVTILHYLLYSQMQTKRRASWLVMTIVAIERQFSLLPFSIIIIIIIYVAIQ